MAFELARVLPPVVVPPLKSARSRLHLGRHDLGLGRPWDKSYLLRRDAYVARVLDDQELVDAIARGARLPARHGVGIDERSVELPWLLAQRLERFPRFLDAGSSLNHQFLLDRFELPREMHVMTLAPERECFWTRGISYLFADLRDIPVRDGFYDAIACISTLEHVGLDTTLFAGAPAAPRQSDEGMLAVMRELARVLRPGGHLYLTVPFGKRRTFSWLRQLDAALLDEVLSAFGPCSERSERYFRYSPSGWQVAQRAECADSEFVEWLAARDWPRSIPLEPDLAAAARAVACITLVKG